MFLITFARPTNLPMYQTLIYCHHWMRWLVLVSLVLAVYRAYKGTFTQTAFSKRDDQLRHWTATFTHIQLMLGIVLYFQSPVTKYFLSHFKEALHNIEISFFGLIHSSLMLIAIVLVTIGSAKSKRQLTDQQKFKTMLIWYSSAFILIFIAIPWPFSPFANRPYFR